MAIANGHRTNFNTLIEAFENGDVALLDCELKSTGEQVAVIVAATHVHDEIEFVPFAMLFNGNPYELLNPPNPDGGFHDTES